MRTNKLILTISIFILPFTLMSLIIRHDIPDQQYITLGKKYPQICHLSGGEATLIKNIL